jgi:hypothetical protein
MTSRTLSGLREGIESIASTDGDYVVRCARTGLRPSPVAGCRFPSRDVARVAARLAGRYRARLRQYDPETVVYDMIVCDLGQPACGCRPPGGHCVGTGTSR